MTIQNSKFKIHNAKLPRFSSVIASSSKHKPQCSIFRKRKIPPVPWLLLSPQRPFAFAGPPLFAAVAIPNPFHRTRAAGCRPYSAPSTTAHKIQNSKFIMQNCLDFPLSLRFFGKLPSYSVIARRLCRRGNLKKRFPRSLRSLGMTHRAKVPTKFRHSAFRHSAFGIPAFGIPALSFRPAVALHGLTVHILSVPIVVKQPAGHLAGAAAEQVRGQLPHHIARIQAL